MSLAYWEASRYGLTDLYIYLLLLVALKPNPGKHPRHQNENQNLNETSQITFILNQPPACIVPLAFGQSPSYDTIRITTTTLGRLWRISGFNQPIRHGWGV